METQIFSTDGNASQRGQSTVSKTYARALLEAYKDSGETSSQVIQDNTAQLIGLLRDSKDLQVVLMGEAISAKEKEAVINELSKRAGFHSVFHRFLVLLTRKNRMGILPEMLSAPVSYTHLTLPTKRIV